jgi:hypothetical protein
VAQSLGSGVIVSADGYVLTNSHVINEGRGEVTVTLPDRREVPAEIIGVDEATDLAVLKIAERNLPTLPWGDSSQLRVAEWVLAIGNPFQLNQTVTLGIVSATGRSLGGRVASYEDFIQTDAAINPGNSGGALINARGELVGINTAIYSESGGYQGIGFAVPSNVARHVMQELIKHGEVRTRRHPGIWLQPLTHAAGRAAERAEHARRADPADGLALRRVRRRPAARRHHRRLQRNDARRRVAPAAAAGGLDARQHRAASSCCATARASRVRCPSPSARRSAAASPPGVRGPDTAEADRVRSSAIPPRRPRGFRSAGSTRTSRAANRMVLDPQRPRVRSRRFCSREMPSARVRLPGRGTGRPERSAAARPPRPPRAAPPHQRLAVERLERADQHRRRQPSASVTAFTR